MRGPAEAFAWAESRVEAARDDPAARLALMERTYHGPTGRAPRQLPFGRAALSFMHWQARRGVLDPLHASPPGSPWWRAVNERLLRDGCEAVALVGGRAGPPSSSAVRLWLGFVAKPTARTWYRAHNASILGAYLEHRRLAEAESAPERFFMDVALVRVLYVHALAAAPRLAAGRLAPLGRLAGRGSAPRASSCLSVGCSRTAIRSLATSRATSPTSSVSAGCSTTPSSFPGCSACTSGPLRSSAKHACWSSSATAHRSTRWPFEERHVWRSLQVPPAARALQWLTHAR